MTNVSKQKLPRKEFSRLYAQLNAVIARLDKSSSAKFFNELLGEEEKIMLTKRLAAVVMYIEDNSPYRVAQLLKLSPSTAESIHHDFENGRYQAIADFITKRREEYEKFWRMLEIVLRAGMPPRGRGRWKSVLKRIG